MYNVILGLVCAKKWKDLVDTFCRKVDKIGSVGGAISDRAAQWSSMTMSFIKEYIVNRK